MKMDLSETSTDLVDLVNENETRVTTDFYQRLHDVLLKLHNRLEYVYRNRLKDYANDEDTEFGRFLDELTIYSSDLHAKTKYKLTYDVGRDIFYLNRIPLSKISIDEIVKKHKDYDFCVDTLPGFEKWVDKLVNFLISEYTLDLSDVPSDLTNFMNLTESYKYLKELEAFVNEHKPLIDLNIFDNKPLVEEVSYKLNLIEEKPSKEIVLRCYYEIPMGTNVQEYDCPLSLSKTELEKLLANTKIEWGTMCFDALEALYDLVSVKQVKERISVDKLMPENGLVNPAGILKRIDSTITVNLSTRINNLSVILQSLSSNNITLNINLVE
jgi:hypothetical protein